MSADRADKSASSNSFPGAFSHLPDGSFRHIMESLASRRLLLPVTWL
ncbi:MAG: hypothetical protein LBK73_06760 [Treponema sp.]|nr:hypothetical protein [Treponema sp.]